MAKSLHHPQGHIPDESAGVHYIPTPAFGQVDAAGHWQNLAGQDVRSCQRLSRPLCSLCCKSVHCKWGQPWPYFGENHCQSQQIDDANAKHQGVSIEARQHSRICKWANSHWEVHSTKRHPRLQEAFDQLQKALLTTPKPPPQKMATLRVVLKSCYVSAGQGPDHQILRHWAFLPDEGLRCLLFITGGMESGSIPIQALMVYIGLLPKPTGGERPIGLTAMLYRLIMRMKKMLLSEWDDKFAGFLDDAVKGSSPPKSSHPPLAPSRGGQNPWL